MITLKAIDTVLNDDNTIAGIPAFGGKICLGLIRTVDGDIADDNGNATLVYDDDGNLSRNYVMMHVIEKEDGQNKIRILFGPKDICELAGLPMEYADTIKEFILNLCGSSGSPVGVIDCEIALPVQVPVNDDEHPSYNTELKPYESTVFVNILDVYKETHNSEVEQIANELYNDILDNTKADENEDMEAAKQKIYNNVYSNVLTKAEEETNYAKLIKNNPSMPELVDSHVFVKTLLGKVCEQIQRAYNKYNYDDQVELLADTISSMSIFNDDGEIVPLSISALENLFKRIKDSIRILPR